MLVLSYLQFACRSVDGLYRQKNVLFLIVLHKYRDGKFFLCSIYTEIVIFLSYNLNHVNQSTDLLQEIFCAKQIPLIKVVILTSIRLLAADILLYNRVTLDSTHIGNINLFYKPYIYRKNRILLYNLQLLLQLFLPRSIL